MSTLRRWLDSFDDEEPEVEGELSERELVWQEVDAMAAEARGLTFDEYRRQLREANGLRLQRGERS